MPTNKNGTNLFTFSVPQGNSELLEFLTEKKEAGNFSLFMREVLNFYVQHTEEPPKWFREWFQRYIENAPMVQVDKLDTGGLWDD